MDGYLQFQALKVFNVTGPEAVGLSTSPNDLAVEARRCGLVWCKEADHLADRELNLLSKILMARGAGGYFVFAFDETRKHRAVSSQ